MHKVMSTSKLMLSSKYIRGLFSDEGLTKKAYLNAIASALDYGSRLVVGFLVQPILVTGLGSYYYGVWQILLRLMGYLSPASGRPAQALKMTLANQQTTADLEKKRQYIGSAILISALFLPLMAILGGLLTWFLPYWIDAPEEYYWTIRLASTVLVVNLILFNLVSVPQSVLEGENLGYKRMGLSAFLVFLGGGLTWLAMYFETGLVGVAVMTLVVTILSGVFYLWVVRLYTPWFGIARPSLQGTYKFFRLSWWFLLWNLIMNLMTASDVVILGVMLSVETVTDYSLSKYTPETLISIVAIIAFGIAPGLGGIIGSGNYVKAARVRGEIMSLTWLIVTVLGSVVLFWNRAFVSLWVGSEHYVGTFANLLIVLVVMQFVFIRNDGNVIDLTLRLSRKVIMGAISVGLSLGIAIALVGRFNLGVVGLSLGLIAGRSILSVGYPHMVGRLLGISFLAQLRRALRPAYVTIFLFLLATFFDYFVLANGYVTVDGWIVLGIYASISFIVVLALAFYFGLSPFQREMIVERIRIVLTIAKS
jgi:O-antigen/teichoic acid export membrane protein